MSGTILVTGAAGYIGSVVVERLLDRGYQIVGFDNLVTGHRAAVHPEAVFVVGDVAQPDDLEKVFAEHDIDAVVHLAGKALIPESVVDPMPFFRTNLAGGLFLLNAMLDHGVKKLVFSSSAAVYGEPNSVPIQEEDPTGPLNSYGESKLAFERALEWCSKAYDMSCTVFRYFCAAGATGSYGEYHLPETHLIPNVLQVALGRQPEVQIFGDDYDTRDGTCVRDFVHVSDIADAHIIALHESGSVGNYQSFNIGSGSGYSVREVVEMARRVTVKPIPARISERRLGDPATLVATSSRAASQLGWTPKYPELSTIIESAYRWHLAHPNGYISEPSK